MRSSIKSGNFNNSGTLIFGPLAPGSVLESLEIQRSDGALAWTTATVTMGFATSANGDHDDFFCQNVDFPATQGAVFPMWEPVPVTRQYVGVTVTVAGNFGMWVAVRCRPRFTSPAVPRVNHKGKLPSVIQG